ncbi:MAG: hypothetical protein JXQ75_13170 [Phycisphaerae bacterium]|nr:hypothetical protein [Phycisphaerae bacterium]
MQHKVIMSFVVGCVVSLATPALAGSAEAAAKSFAAGKAFLSKADFDGAMGAFKAAAKADPGNQEYAQQYAMLRQVIRMRGDCRKEQDAERWLKMAGALRTFYHDHRLYSESLPLDAERHRRHRSSESAVLLAETQLALGMNSEAAEMLSVLTKEQTSPRARVLHGLALARLGRIDEAKKLAEEPRQAPDDVGPRYFYDLARLQALTRDSKSACEALTRSFELTPPSQLDAFKAEAKEHQDFGALVGTARFAKVLETASKVRESKCSKGAGCGKCPMRAKCEGEKSKDAKKGQ